MSVIITHNCSIKLLHCKDTILTYCFVHTCWQAYSWHNVFYKLAYCTVRIYSLNLCKSISGNLKLFYRYQPMVILGYFL